MINCFRTQMHNIAGALSSLFYFIVFQWQGFFDSAIYIANYSIFLKVTIKAMYDQLVELHHKRGELRFGIAVSGTLYVMTTGISMMHMLYADNLDTEEQQQPIKVLIMDMAPDRYSLMTCGALEGKHLFWNAATIESMSITVVKILA